jgi:SAM-dependent methyltransferase
VDDLPTNDDVRRAWDENAGFWDRRLSEPDSWQQTLIFPAIERLLDPRADERILEVACGTGLLARRMAAAGAKVVATDFSEAMLAHARERLGGTDVELRRLDLTVAAELADLGSFDAVVASMALMDVSDIGPFAEAMPRLLEPGGRFVFAVTHPAFNNVSSVLLIERPNDDPDLRSRYAVKISRYLTPSVGCGAGIPGQPAAQWYFDRPLSELLRPFLEAGLVLDVLEEPSATDASDQPVWREIPPILLARLRVA